MLNTKGLVTVPCRRNARGFMDPLCPCGISLRPPQGPNMRLPIIVSLLDAAASAVIGPLTKKPDAEPKQVHDCVETSAWSVRCVDLEP